MPWGDATGPWGMGPMTGRAAGYCAGYPVSGSMNPVPGRMFAGRFTRGGAYMPYPAYYGNGRPIGLGRGGFTRGWRCFGRGRGRGRGRFARFRLW